MTLTDIRDAAQAAHASALEAAVTAEAMVLKTNDDLTAAAAALASVQPQLDLIDHVDAALKSAEQAALVDLASAYTQLRADIESVPAQLRGFLNI